MIIFEGPPGSGKSALAAELGEALTYYPGTEDFRYWQQQLQTDAYALYDGGFYAEAVYGPILRGYSRLTPYQLRYLEYQAATYGAMVVWCSANQDDLPKRGGSIYETVRAEELAKRFGELAAWSRLHNVHYNSSVERPRDVANLVRAAAPGGRDWPHRGVGTTSPQAVLVGEGWPGHWPAPEDPRWSTEYAHLRPFDGSRSGEFLLKTLELTPYGPNQLYLTNGRKQWTRNSIAELRLELSSLAGTPRRVALGNEAARELRLAGFRAHVVVPHPQYVSRFHIEKLRDYSLELERAIHG